MERPENVLFPYTPYPIQANFMKNFYTIGKWEFLKAQQGSMKLADRTGGTEKLSADMKAELDWKIKKMEAKHLDDWYKVRTKQSEVNLEK